MEFEEGQMFYEDSYSWQIDHLLGVPSIIQTLLYHDENLAGRWLFKPNATVEEIKSFMSERIKEVA